VLTLTGSASAQQWTTSTNGSGNISNANTGNVGVGTTAPAYGLHVEGASTAANNYVQAFFKNTGSAFPYGGVAVDGQSQSHVRFMLGGLPKWQWRVGAGAGTDDLRAYNWALNSDVLTLTNGGGVGIGTNSPLSRLHVEGGAALGSIRVSGAGMAVMNFKDTAAGANQKLYQWRSEGGSFRMTLLNDDEATYARQNILVASPSGNVGVGTGTPSTALEVGGGGTLSLSGGAGSGQGNIRFGATPSTLYDTNLIHVNSNAATTGIVAGALPTYSAANGAYAALRGNAFTAIPEQRGVLAFSAGNVSSPVGKEGGISFMTGADQVRLFISPTGVVGVGGVPAAGSTHKLDVTGSVKVSVNLDVTGDITGGTVSATFQDVAEWVPSTQKLAAGTVVVLDTGRTNHVVASGSAYDTKVAGVVSGQPGVLLGVAGEGKVKVATTGRVKVRVDASRGAVKVGDLLVTSGVEGVAMKSVPVDLGGIPIHRPGTIIGKALEPLEKGTGEILVLLSLQ
jgi:hypothetical protein